MSAADAQQLPAVLVDGVSKTFRMPRERVHTLKERMLHPLRRASEDELRALRDVSFRVEPGEFFGVVGRNGSGKSTLLKCLAGIYGVNQGDIYVNGRVSTFIELGVGFNPDLPAYDNVMLNGTMLGLTPREARARFDGVIDFAELRDFTDLKLKNYSSGMMVRLAFAVMIQVDADILLIDEVLAVGDASFQQKCFEEFERIRRSGKTVLLVTHDMGAVRRFCDRAMLLEHGRMVAEGDPEQVGNRYLQLNFSEEARAAADARSDVDERHAAIVGTGERTGDRGAEILEAWFEDEHGVATPTLETGRPAAFVARVRFNEDIESPLFSVAMTNSQRHQMLSASSVFDFPDLGTFAAGSEAIFRVAFDNILGPDRYAVTTAVVQQDGSRWLDFRDRMFSIMVTSTRQVDALVDVPRTISLERDGAAIAPTRRERAAG
jgi:ABC-type polysaccharide/polyol phosphate transport system ATPase subunit